MQSMPGVEGGVDGGVAVRVGGDLQAAAVRLVGDRREFLGRVLLGAGRTGRRDHAARPAALDDLGAVLDLVADGLADLVDPVGDALLDRQRHDVRGERRLRARVEVAAGRDDRVAGGHDPAALDPAGVDRLRQRDVEQVPARLDEQAEVAHGRESGEQRAAGVGCAAQRHLHRIGPHRIVEAGAGTAEHEVDLHVHQTRDERQLRQLDTSSASSAIDGVGSDGGDPVALHPHVARLDHVAGVDVEDAGRVENGHG